MDSLRSDETVAYVGSSLPLRSYDIGQSIPRCFDEAVHIRMVESASLEPSHAPYGSIMLLVIGTMRTNRSQVWRP